MIRMSRANAISMISIIGGLRPAARKLVNKNGQEMAHANLKKMVDFVENQAGTIDSDQSVEVSPWLAEQLIDVSRQHIGKNSPANQVMRYIAIHDWQVRRLNEPNFDVCEYAKRSLAHMLFAVGQGYVTTHEFIDLDDDIQSTGKYEKEVAEAFTTLVQDYADNY